MCELCVLHTYVINCFEAIVSCNGHNGKVPKIEVKETEGLKGSNNITTTSPDNS